LRRREGGRREEEERSVLERRKRKKEARKGCDERKNETRWVAERSSDALAREKVRGTGKERRVERRTEVELASRLLLEFIREDFVCYRCTLRI